LFEISLNLDRNRGSRRPDICISDTGEVVWCWTDNVRHVQDWSNGARAPNAKKHLCQDVCAACACMCAAASATAHSRRIDDSQFFWTIKWNSACNYWSVSMTACLDVLCKFCRPHDECTLADICLYALLCGPNRWNSIRASTPLAGS